MTKFEKVNKTCYVHIRGYIIVDDRSGTDVRINDVVYQDYLDALTAAEELKQDWLTVTTHEYKATIA